MIRLIFAFAFSLVLISTADAMSARDHLAVFTAIVVEADLLGGTIDPLPAPAKVKRSQCPECKGTGRVRTGDGILEVECQNCEPDSSAACPCGDACDCAPDRGCGCADRVPVLPVADTISTALASGGGCADGSCSLPRRSAPLARGAKSVARPIKAAARRLRTRRPLRRAVGCLFGRCG